MRYAVLTDIHSNLPALHAVLNRIGELEIDRIVSLGDIVGYNADPNECVALIKDLSIAAIAGNHDTEAVSTAAPRNLNEPAEKSILWTRKRLTKENKDFLRNLPSEIEVDNLFIALHSPKDITNKYINSKYAAAAAFKLMLDARTRPLAFLGHTHRRSIFSLLPTKAPTKDPTINHIEDIVKELPTPHKEKIKIEKNKLYLINPGSVGQPRDGDPRAGFLTFNSASYEIEFHLVTYDIKTTVKKIIAAGLPEINAKRLRLGQ